MRSVFKIYLPAVSLGLFLMGGAGEVLSLSPRANGLPLTLGIAYADGGSGVSGGYGGSEGSVGSGGSNPFPGVCDRCPTVTVNCGVTMPPGTAAQSSPESCSIDLTQEMCDLQGFASGPYSPGGFQAQNQCQAGLKASGSIKGYADKCCSIRHEYAHICDPRYLPGGPNPKSQCTEQFAENSENQCENDVINSACSNPGALTDDQRSQCSSFCDWQVTRSITKIWDSCMCGQQVAEDPTGGFPAHLNSDACCGCYNSCNNPGAAKALMPSACSNYPNWQQGLEGSVKSACDTLASGSGAPDANGGHGCGHYGGPSNFKASACGANCGLVGKLWLSDPSCSNSDSFKRFLEGGMFQADQTQCASETDIRSTAQKPDRSYPVPWAGCDYNVNQHYCKSPLWIDYPTDVPAKMCPSPDWQIRWEF